jgi:hypothetical protein
MPLEVLGLEGPNSNNLFTSPFPLMTCLRFGEGGRLMSAAGEFREMISRDDRRLGREMSGYREI